MGLFKKKDTEKDLLAHQAEQDASVGTAADVEAVMKKYDRESNTRSWEGTPKLLIRILMAAFAAYSIVDTVLSLIHISSCLSGSSWSMWARTARSIVPS